MERSNFIELVVASLVVRHNGQKDPDNPRKVQNIPDGKYHVTFMGQQIPVHVAHGIVDVEMDGLPF